MEQILASEALGKMISIFVSILFVYKLYNILINMKIERLKSNYEFAERIIENNRWKYLHDYLLEKAYLTLSGKQLNAKEIRYFLGRKDPSQHLNLFSKSKKFLEVVEDNGTPIINFHNKYRGLWERRWLKLLYFIFYVVFIFLGVFPIVFLLPSNKDGISIWWVVSSIMWLVSCVMVAVMQLVENGRLQDAEYLVSSIRSTSKGQLVLENEGIIEGEDKEG
ncbi:MAG: hypothetical protein V3U87_17240 [Methylococcaceae bacterium]